ncbi:MAG: NifU family protein [Marinirhabdus sp.]
MNVSNISISPTSNPSIVKFEATTFLTPADSFEFKNIDEAGPSPLAQQLFYLPFVKTVYISQNFVAIEKYDIVAWADVQDEVATAIETYLKSGKKVITEAAHPPEKTPVTLYAESTPNPEVLKFVANKALVNGTFEFKEKDTAQNAPLPRALFDFPFVKEVFVSANYVSVTKHKTTPWGDITFELREFLRQYIQQGKPVLSDVFLQQRTAVQNNTVQAKHAPTELDGAITEILDEYIKPAVAGDGGHIAFQGYDPENKTVHVVLQGACSGCPSATVTLKNGIETMLREMLPGKVERVEAINA